MDQYRSSDIVEKKKFLQWAYFLDLVPVEGDLRNVSSIIDFCVILVLYIYYQACSFWVISHDFEVVLSHETERMIKEYIKLLDE